MIIKSLQRMTHRILTASVLLLISFLHAADSVCTPSETSQQSSQMKATHQPPHNGTKIVATPEPISPTAWRLGFTSLNAEMKVKKLPVEGKVPAWLRGSFISTGPGKYEIKESKGKTWLDGFAMLHRFSFTHEGVSYVNKFIETNYYSESCQKGAMCTSAICDANASYFTKLAAALSDSDRPPYDNVNVNVLCHNNCCMAVTETPAHVCFDKKTLKTKGKVCYQDSLKPHVACPHPFIDPATGEWINFATTFGRKSSYTIYKMSPKNLERVPLATLSTSYPSYMHSFSCTPHYVILIEVPLVVSPYDLAMNGKPFMENFVWKNQPTTITVVNRATGATVGQYTTDPFFTLHHVNAREVDGTQILIDLVAYPNDEIVKTFYLEDVLKKENHAFQQGMLKRITIDIKTKKVTVSPLHQTPLEMPRINQEYLLTKSYSYVYGLSSENGRKYYDRIVKLNITDGSQLLWKSDFCYPSEAIFIAKPDAKKEDDGVLLSIVLDSASKKSFLLILDATTMKEVARVQLQHHIPFTVHGNFFPKPKPTIKEAFDAALHR